MSISVDYDAKGNKALENLDWNRETRAPSREPGLGGQLTSVCLVAGSWPMGPGQTQPKEVAWSINTVGPQWVHL